MKFPGKLQQCLIIVIIVLIFTSISVVIALIGTIDIVQ
jgi:hypothetical protein